MNITIFFYQLIWSFARNILTNLNNQSRLLIFIDRILMRIINKGYYSWMLTGIDVLEKNESDRNLKITFGNMGLTGRNMYIGIYYALLANNHFINYGKSSNHRKIFISHAITRTREFSLHNNILYQNNITLSSFLQNIEPNLIYLQKENYLDNFIYFFEVVIWDINTPINKYIKISNLKSVLIRKKISATPFIRISSLFGLGGNLLVNREIYFRSYSTNNIKFNKLVKNWRDFTPLNINIETKMNLVAMDIETMKSINGKPQTPVLITIAIAKHNDIKYINKHYFLLNKNVMDIEGLKSATHLLWAEVFTFISSNIPDNSIIFTHNLGGFDGLYIFKGLLSFINRKDVQTIIDKENNFIQIIAVIKGYKFIWKDSLRIFDVKLDDLCKTFGFKGKLSKYNPEFNKFTLFNNTKMLDKFIKYALQDSVGLLKALLRAQDIYVRDYNVDIGSIWSTSTLSLKIFRLNFLNETIPSLNKSLDFFIRKSYFGGATDHYKLYGENLYYYDINSLYPHVMLQDMPLHHIKYHNNLSEYNFASFFGFCLAEIECPTNIKTPLLPFRTISNEVIYPTGCWTGVYFSELLKEVVKHGYKVKLIEGHEFSKAKLFNNYVEHFYNIKQN